MLLYGDLMRFSRLIDAEAEIERISGWPKAHVVELCFGGNEEDTGFATRGKDGQPIEYRYAIEAAPEKFLRDDGSVR